MILCFLLVYCIVSHCIVMYRIKISVSFQVYSYNHHLQMIFDCIIDKRKKKESELSSSVLTIINRSSVTGLIQRNLMWFGSYSRLWITSLIPHVRICGLWISGGKKKNVRQSKESTIRYSLPYCCQFCSLLIWEKQKTGARDCQLIITAQWYSLSGRP